MSLIWYCDSDASTVDLIIKACRAVEGSTSRGGQDILDKAHDRSAVVLRLHRQIFTFVCGVSCGNAAIQA